ncbi:MAG TPA: HEAT repeat domain-containing protein, partial [Candidatus Sulfotelmatobacter sp.]|nr:HEAT repeat domain-containing protein [Candidatus Sulfotelmatobacter sp.]
LVGRSMSPDKLHHAIDCLRSSDSLLYDEGYHMLQGEFLKLHLDTVIALCKKESNPVIRGRLIELLGDSGEPRVIPIIAEELVSKEDEVRRWALRALDCLATPDAQAIAALHRSSHPEDGE